MSVGMSRQLADIAAANREITDGETQAARKHLRDFIAEARRLPDEAVEDAACCSELRDVPRVMAARLAATWGRLTTHLVQAQSRLAEAEAYQETAARTERLRASLLAEFPQPGEPADELACRLGELLWRGDPEIDALYRQAPKAEEPAEDASHEQSAPFEQEAYEQEMARRAEAMMAVRKVCLRKITEAESSRASD